MGFLELKEMNLPSIPWKQYTGKEEFSDDYLWSIRSAVYRGNDLNLPRSIGKTAQESKIFADKLLNTLNENGIVIYYPYFIAKKSGTLEVRNNSAIIEAVKEDLWNLVTFSDREVTIFVSENNQLDYVGNSSFLSKDEQNELIKHIQEIRKIFRNDLIEGKSALFEWSFACTCNQYREPSGKDYLVFYEARTVK